MTAIQPLKFQSDGYPSANSLPIQYNAIMHQILCQSSANPVPILCQNCANLCAHPLTIHCQFNANLLRICQSSTNLGTKAALNLGTSLLLGPTNSLNGGWFCTWYYPTASPIHCHNANPSWIPHLLIGTSTTGDHSKCRIHFQWDATPAPIHF